jgi:hypothetical protein
MMVMVIMMMMMMKKKKKRKKTVAILEVMWLKKYRIRYYYTSLKFSHKYFVNE